MTNRLAYATIHSMRPEYNQNDHPWQRIPLSVYETHMGGDQVGQLQALNACMQDQLNRYPVRTAAVLGIAGGNGLEHVDATSISTLYGIDINASYLQEAVRRFPQLEGVFIPLCIDLAKEAHKVPHCDLLIADLVVEYLGYDAFCHVVQAAQPPYISVVIQMQEAGSFVSNSPLKTAFDCLESILHPLSEEGLGKLLVSLGYRTIHAEKIGLSNLKWFLRFDYRYESQHERLLNHHFS